MIGSSYQELNIKGDEGQEEKHTYEDKGSKEGRASGSVEWEDDDFEDEEGEEVNLHEDSLMVDDALYHIENVVEEMADYPAPDVDSDDENTEMPIEFLHSLVYAFLLIFLSDPYDSTSNFRDSVSVSLSQVSLHCLA